MRSPAGSWAGGGVEHEDRDGPRSVGDGETLSWEPSPGRAHVSLGRRISIHKRAFHRTPRRDRGPTLNWHRGRFVRHALAETTNGLYKAECVYGPDTNGWDDVEHLELATLSWVSWFNEDRLHSYCGDVPPAEFEAAFYAAQQADQSLVGIQ